MFPVTFFVYLFVFGEEKRKEKLLLFIFFRFRSKCRRRSKISKELYRDCKDLFRCSAGKRHFSREISLGFFCELNWNQFIASEKSQINFPSSSRHRNSELNCETDAKWIQLSFSPWSATFVVALTDWSLLQKTVFRVSRNCKWRAKHARWCNGQVEFSSWKRILKSFHNLSSFPFMIYGFPAATKHSSASQTFLTTCCWMKFSLTWFSHFLVVRARNERIDS